MTATEVPTNVHKYNDGLCCGGRRPRLYLAKGGEVRKFVGKNIPDFCAVATVVYQKSGKWSNTDYTLNLAPGVRAMEFLSPLHGTWGDDLSSWGEVAERLSLPVDVAQAIVRAEYRETAERLDQLETFAVAFEQQGAATETVIVSFGSPTNRNIREGYWSQPKTAQTTDGRTVTVQPGQGEYGPDWYTAEAVAPNGAKVLSSRHKPGMHGGYWTVEVAIPIRQN
jgi:hypothetical protein